MFWHSRSSSNYYWAKNINIYIYIYIHTHTHTLAHQQMLCQTCPCFLYFVTFVICKSVLKCFQLDVYCSVIMYDFLITFHCVPQCCFLSSDILVWTHIKRQKNTYCIPAGVLNFFFPSWIKAHSCASLWIYTQLTLQRCFSNIISPLSSCTCGVSTEMLTDVFTMPPFLETCFVR